MSGSSRAPPAAAPVGRGTSPTVCLLLLNCHLMLWQSLCDSSRAAWGVSLSGVGVRPAGLSGGLTSLKIKPLALRGAVNGGQQVV